MSADSIHHIRTVEEYRAYVKEACIIKFTAGWCGPCKKIQPLYQELARVFSKTPVKFLEVDVEDQDLMEIVKEEEIAGIPNFSFHFHSEKYDSFSGANSDLLKESSKKFVSSVRKHLRAEAKRAKDAEITVVKLKEPEPELSEPGITIKLSTLKTVSGEQPVKQSALIKKVVLIREIPKPSSEQSIKPSTESVNPEDEYGYDM